MKIVDKKSDNCSLLKVPVVYLFKKEVSVIIAVIVASTKSTKTQRLSISYTVITLTSDISVKAVNQHMTYVRYGAVT